MRGYDATKPGRRCWLAPWEAAPIRAAGGCAARPSPAAAWGAAPMAERVEVLEPWGMLWMLVRLVLVPIAIGVSAGVAAGSAWVAGGVAGAVLAATYVWRDHLGPARVPRELRPPRR